MAGALARWQHECEADGTHLTSNVLRLLWMNMTIGTSSISANFITPHITRTEHACVKSAIVQECGFYGRVPPPPIAPGVRHKAMSIHLIILQTPARQTDNMILYSIWVRAATLKHTILPCKEVSLSCLTTAEFLSTHLTTEQLSKPTNGYSIPTYS